VTEPASVTMTVWRQLPANELKLLRKIDMSALPLVAFRDSATLADSVFLEEAILPVALRVIRRSFFAGCWRLMRVDTTAVHRARGDPGRLFPELSPPARIQVSADRPRGRSRVRLYGDHVCRPVRDAGRARRIH
jgi:hypothetical protein